MRKISIFVLMMFLISCSKTVECSEIEYSDGISYYKGNVFNGDCKSKFPSGNMSSYQSYAMGKDNGAWIFYYENGFKKTEAFFNKGKRIGQWIYYHENGKIWKIQRYSMSGQKTGIWKTYSTKGELIKTEVINN